MIVTSPPCETCVFWESAGIALPSDRLVDCASTHGTLTLMSTKKLSSLNPYLRDPAVRKRTVMRSVLTFSAIEGIRGVFKRPRTGDRSPGRPTMPVEAHANAPVFKDVACISYLPRMRYCSGFLRHGIDQKCECSDQAQPVIRLEQFAKCDSHGAAVRIKKSWLINLRYRAGSVVNVLTPIEYVV
jgi:hypothetical protein